MTLGLTDKVVRVTVPFRWSSDKTARNNEVAYDWSMAILHNNAEGFGWYSALRDNNPYGDTPSLNPDRLFEELVDILVWETADDATLAEFDVSRP